jgi:hypothetical protein
VIGWELAIPEFYVIEGYDEIGYYYNGPGAENGPSPKHWKELGESGIGMLEIISIEPGKHSSDKQIIKEALEFALEFNAGNPEWVLPDYRAGLNAYQVWIDAVKSGQGMLMGHAYNAAVWEECRRNGVSFLQEAKNRVSEVNKDSINGAVRAYGEVAKQLKRVTELYPFFENNREEPLGVNDRSQEAAEWLKAAQTAEEEGQSYLKEIVDNLSL